MDGLIIVLLIIEAVLFAVCWACPKCHHHWHMIAKDVCLGNGKRCDIYECGVCGKIKIV